MRTARATIAAGESVGSPRRRTGAALVEMALVLSILLMLTLGAAEYGYAYFVKHNLQGAAREGSRAAILAGATSQNVTDAVKAVMEAGRMGASGYTVLVTDAATGKTADPGTAAAGTMIQVEVQCTWGAVGIRAMPVGGISPATVLKARAVMRKEG